MIPLLLLRNTAQSVDSNACFANSVIQILRRIPNIKDNIIDLNLETRIHSELKQILSAEGTQRRVSASRLRFLVGQQFATGDQMDCKEFFDILLEKLGLGFDENFKFKVKNTFQFIGSDFSPACCYCHLVEDPVIETETSLNLPVFRYGNLSLQNLVDQYFQFEALTKKCSRCLNQAIQNYQLYKGFFEPGPFLIIQLKRFHNILEKLKTFVPGSFFINVNKIRFKLIAIIDHIGELNSGHYKPLLEHNGKWYVCEDDYYPVELPKEKIFSNQNYIYVFEKVSIEVGSSVHANPCVSMASQAITTSTLPITYAQAAGRSNVAASSATSAADSSGSSHAKSLFSKKGKSYIELVDISSDDSDDTAVFVPLSGVSNTFPPSTNIKHLPKQISSWFSNKGKGKGKGKQYEQPKQHHPKKTAAQITQIIHATITNKQ